MRRTAEEPAGTTGSPAPTSANRRWHLPAVVGYVALTAWVMWPAVRGFRTQAVSNNADGAMFSWLWGAMPSELGAGRNPYRTELMFHPVGADLRMTTSSPLVMALTWPVRAALGPHAQVNALQLASMFLAGLAMYLLAYRACARRSAAFVAGVGYAMLPNRFIHAIDGHHNLIESAVIPFGLLVLLRFIERPTTMRGVALGGVCGSAFLIDPQLTILLLLGMAVLGLVHRRVLLAEVRRLAGAAVVAVVVALPLLAPMAAAMVAGQVGEPDPTSSTLVYSSSPLSWVVPPFDWLWLERFVSIEPLTPTGDGVVYPGLVLLLLSLAGVSLSSRDQRKGWVAIALVSFVLSLGPYIFARNTMLEVPMPFFAFRAIPGLDAMRVPGRFGLLGAVGIDVLAAVALTDVSRRWPRRAHLIAGLAVLVTAFELFPRSLPIRDPGISEVYEAIANDEAQGAVLEIPIKWSTTQEQIGFEGNDEDFLFLLYQTVHRRPTVSGAVSRFPDEDLTRLVETPLYRQVLALGGETGYDDPATFDRRDLEALDIDFVVYHRDDAAPAALAYLRSLQLPVLADDGTVIAWKVPSG